MTTMYGDRAHGSSADAALVFDYQGLCERLAGKVELVDQLLDLLLAEYPQQRQCIAERAADGDSRGVREAAHRLKGQLQTLGVNQAATAAHRLELMGRDQDLCNIAGELMELESQMQRFRTVVAERRRSPLRAS